MTWYDATLEAVKELVRENNSPFLIYKEIKQKKLGGIVLKTKTVGKTPENSLSLFLQNIRDKGLLRFVDNRGLYFFIDNALDSSFSNEKLANNPNKEITNDIETDEVIYQTKIRKGQNTLRDNIIKNYNCQCAFCGITEKSLLIASHIFRWSDDRTADYRGKLDNIICMCEMHDALFELGYFTITETYEIVDNYSGNDAIIKDLIRTSKFKQPKKYPPNVFCIKQHHFRIGLEKNDNPKI